MKANAPDKIYACFGVFGLIQATEIRATSKDVEYTRTDAFIEKACDVYCKVCGHYPHTTPNHICRQMCDYYKDFKKYIEG